jgi:hypothetical protein
MALPLPTALSALRAMLALKLRADEDAAQTHATEPVPVGKRADCRTARFREIATMAWYRRARFDGISNCDEWAPCHGADPAIIEPQGPEIRVIFGWAGTYQLTRTATLLFFGRDLGQKHGFRGRLFLLAVISLHLTARSAAAG